MLSFCMHVFVKEENNLLERIYVLIERLHCNYHCKAQRIMSLLYIGFINENELIKMTWAQGFQYGSEHIMMNE